jgi:hypothetical protein
MNVVALSSPEWRRRIVDYSGQMVEGSDGTLPSTEAPSPMESSECASATIGMSGTFLLAVFESTST